MIEMSFPEIASRLSRLSLLWLACQQPSSSIELLAATVCPRLFLHKQGHQNPHLLEWALLPATQAADSQRAPMAPSPTRLQHNKEKERQLTLRTCAEHNPTIDNCDEQS